MRPDMAKVIVERPRYGSRLPSKGKGYNRRTAHIAWEDQPKREGMKLRGGRMKTLNEHLSPLRRYLQSQVGRPWDTVFADLCRYVDRASAVQDHVRDHVNDYVAVRTMIVGEQLCHADGWRIGTPVYTPFYVCPLTGILKKNKNYGRRWLWWSAPHRSDKPKVHFLSPRLGLVRHGGAWFMVRFERLPLRDARPGVPARELRRFDLLLKLPLRQDEAEEVYGQPIYAAEARRASKREVRSVVSSYPHTNLVR